MSIPLINEAFDCDLPPTDKFILVSLADQANPMEGNCCWPSVKTISARTGYSPSTIHAALNRLEAGGRLTRIHRKCTSTKYRIHPKPKFKKAVKGIREPETPSPRNGVTPSGSRSQTRSNPKLKQGGQAKASSLKGLSRKAAPSRKGRVGMTQQVGDALIETLRSLETTLEAKGYAEDE